MSDFSFSVNAGNHPQAPTLRELFAIATYNGLDPNKFAYEVVRGTGIIAMAVVAEETGAVIFTTHSKKELPGDIAARILETNEAIKSLTVPA